MAGIFSNGGNTTGGSKSKGTGGIFKNYSPSNKAEPTPVKKQLNNTVVKLSTQAQKEADYYKANPLADKLVHNPISQFWDKKIVPVLDVAGTAMKGAITGDYSSGDKVETTGNKTLDTVAKAGGTIGAFALPVGGASSIAQPIRSTAEGLVTKIIPSAPNLISKAGKKVLTGAIESVPYSAQQIATQKDIKTPQDALRTVGLNAALGSGTELALAGLGAAAKAIYTKIKVGKGLTKAEIETAKKTPELMQLPEVKRLLLPERATSKIEVGGITTHPKIEPAVTPDFYVSENNVARSLTDFTTPPKTPLALPEGRGANANPKNKDTMLDMLRRSVNEPVYKDSFGNIDTPLQATKAEFRPGKKYPSNLQKLSTNIKHQNEATNIMKFGEYGGNIGQKYDYVNSPTPYKDTPLYKVQDQFKREQPLKVLPGEMANKPLVELPTLKNIMNKAETAKTANKTVSENIDDLIKNSDKWKDKGGITGPLRLQRETWDRNIVDIAGKNEGAKVKEAIFDPIHENEAASTRFKNHWRNNIKSLNLSNKESELVQKLGEGKITINEVNAIAPNSVYKVQNAVNTFRKFYDEVINSANEALTRNGYKPVGKLDQYFPHFEGDDPVMKALGISLDVKDLPTDINGLTHQFKPGKNWFGNFQKRTGDKTAFDAVQGFDRYIEGISKVIYHTDDIQRLRTFTRKLRMKYSPQEIQDQVTNIMNSEMSREVKDAAIDELMGRSTTHLSNAVADLDEYTNVLAGKKDLADRAAERTFGRKIYNIANTITNRVGKNMVAINPGSWITNFIPITQSLATTRKDAVIQALTDTMRNVVKNDNFIDKSTFLTNRVGSDILDKSFIEKSGDVLTTPFKWIDNFTSQVVTRAKYLEGIKQGMSPDTAIKKADDWAAKILGDRSVGAQPTLFNQRNPVTRMLTQFQLEVNNQLSFLFKDIPREALKDGTNAKSVAKLTSAVGQLVLYGYLFNNIYESATGRRPALDPLGVAFDFKKDLANPNLKKSEAVVNLASNVGQQLPFSSTLLNGGRIPLSSALPDMAKVGNATVQMASGEMPQGEGLKRIGGEIGKTALYVGLPFGAGQAKKTYEGISAVKQGAEYSTNVKGEKQLKYPIAKTTGNYVKAGVFGKSSLKETQQYYRDKVKALGVEQTKVYEDAVTKGIDPATVYSQIQIWRKLQPDAKHKGITKAQKVQSLNENDKLTAAQKAIMRKLFLTTDK